MYNNERNVKTEAIFFEETMEGEGCRWIEKYIEDKDM